MSSRADLATTAACLLAVVGICGPASAQSATQDLAVGNGATPTFFSHFDFTANSDSVGGSPGGTASWEQFGYHFDGTVSCLAVTDNRAIIGIDVNSATSGLTAQGFFLTVRDRGPAGSGRDSFDAVPTFLTSVGDIVPTDCSGWTTTWSWEEPVTSGDISISDAPNLPTSTSQCTSGGWRIYRVFSGAGDCVSFVATGGKNPPDNAPPPPLLDQSFTSPTNATGILNDCCNVVAQTFTAGRDGTLLGINIDTYDATPSLPDPPLRVSIRNTLNGLPGSTVLATTLLPSPISPLSQLVTFPETIHVNAGAKYAIVLNLENPGSAAAGWVGARADWYPQGDACIDLGQWSCYTDDIDFHFRTYVANAAPTSKDVCQNGWRRFGFKNHGDCASFVATGRKNPAGR
jgi:hypothetical protein